MYLDIRYVSKDSKQEIINQLKAIDSSIIVEVLAEGEVYQCNLSDKEVIRYIRKCEKILEKKIQKNFVKVQVMQDFLKSII